MTASNSTTTTAGGRFADRVAIVTGANDRGIGAAIALRLAREGADLAVFGLEEPKRLAKRIDKLGRAFLWRKGDVRERDQIDDFVTEVAGIHGRIDVLVNNAGIDQSGPLADFEDEDIERVVGVNLLGVMKFTRAVLPHLTQPGGVVVNITSATALAGNALQTLYSSSKAALVGFTRSLAMELVPKKQRAVAVAPGTVLTPMTRRYLGDPGTQSFEELVERADRGMEVHPLGIGLPEDVASAVAFLASDEARWISGVTLPLGYCPHYPQPVDMIGE